MYWLGCAHLMHKNVWCRTILSRFINSSTHRGHYCNSLPWSRVDTWSRLSSACTIRLLWCAWRCFSGMQMKSMRLTHLSIWAYYQCHLFWPSSYHPFEWHVSSKTTHHMSHQSSWSSCWCVVAFCIIPSAETQDFLWSWSLHQWSPVIVYLIDLSINNTVSMLRSSLSLPTSYCSGWLLSIKELSVELERFYLNCPEVTCLLPTSHHLVHHTSCLLWPYVPRLLWYISIHEIMSALAHRHIRWLSFASIFELKLREFDIHICQVWYWYHLSSSISQHDSYQLYGCHVLHISSQGSFGSL